METSIKFKAKVIDTKNGYYPDWMEGFYYQDLEKGKIVHKLFDPTSFDVEINPSTLTILYDGNRYGSDVRNVVVDEIIDKIEQLKGLHSKMSIGEWSSILINLLEKYKEYNILYHKNDENETKLNLK